MISISNNKFNTKNAIIEAYLVPSRPSLKWGIEIECEEKNFFSPSINCDNIFAGKENNCDTFEDISNYFDSENISKLESTIYLNEHYEMKNNILIMKNIDPLHIELEWTSFVNGKIFSPENKMHDVFIKVTVAFKGIWCGKRSESDSRQLLSKLVDLDDFKFSEVHHGVSFFEPIPTME